MLERDNAESPWRLEFSAPDRQDVVDEIADRRDHGVKASNLRIRQTFATRQSELDRLLAQENSPNEILAAVEANDNSPIRLVR